MVFSSHIFLFWFLPLALYLYYASKGRARIWVLTLVSYVFYGFAGPWFILVILWSTLVDFICGNLIYGHWRLIGPRTFLPDGEPRASEAQRRLFLSVSIFSNLTLLGIFKYGVFIQHNLAAIVGKFPILAIALPVGISFYTFESISYVVDIYKGRARPASRALVTPLRDNPTRKDKLRRARQELAAFGNFACYITQYPHLVAGPIIRFQELEPQLLSRTHTLEKFGQGVFFFSLGLAKKILIADTVATVADATFAAAAIGPGTAWFGVFAYAFEIYFDFSGYSDMAVGLGLMHGFEFPKNFDSPYKSKSISEFWRRWHMTLSAWLRDYLYIPLGGNRRGRGRTYVNLMLVMLLGGLWHGAAWKFVAWGGIHGLWLAIERAVNFEKRFARVPAWLKILFTFTIINLAWVFFRAADFRAAVAYLACMFKLPPMPVPASEAFVRLEAFSLRNVTAMIAAAAIALFGVQTWDLSKKITPPRAIFAIGLLIWSIYTLTMKSSVPFLYFQF